MNGDYFLLLHVRYGHPIDVALRDMAILLGQVDNQATQREHLDDIEPSSVFQRVLWWFPAEEAAIHPCTGGIVAYFCAMSASSCPFFVSYVVVFQRLTSLSKKVLA